MPASSAPDRLRFRRAPLAAAAVWFALGIALQHLQRAQAVRPATVELLGGFLLLAALAAISLARNLRTAWLGVAGVWIVLGLAAAAWHPSPPYPAHLLGFADNLSRTVEARVVRVRPALAAPAADEDQAPPWESTEEVPGPAGHPLSVDLAVDAIEDVTPDRSTLVPTSGGIRVTVYQAEHLNLRCGDHLELPLRLRPPQRFRDPGVFQYADLLQEQGIAIEANAQSNAITVRAGGAAPFSCRLAAAQSWASGRLLAFTQSAANRSLPRALRLDPGSASMLNAMLFGDRSGLSHSLRTGFERTGSFHLFVVSGLHIALLAGGVFWLLRRLRLPPWIATLLTVAVATVYAALTGWGQPVQRSLLMVSAYLAARLLSRHRDPLNALGAAVLALLVWSPASLFEASFQMTALAIVAIAGIAVPLGQYTVLRFAHAAAQVFRRPRRLSSPAEQQLCLMLELWGETFAGLLGSWSRRLPARLVQAFLWALELALIGTVAELVMVLPMALYFHRAAVFALPANMVVIPVIAILAPLGLATFVASLLSPWLAAVPAAATAGLLHLLAWTIARLSHLSVADVRVPGPPAFIAVLAVLGWLGCCWAVRRGPRGAAATALVLPVIALGVLWPHPALVSPGTLEVTALDVGQGDSLLAVNPEGAAMLIDAGGPVGRGAASEVVSSFDIGEEVVAPYLWSRRLRRLDIVVLSHAHTDHMGGMPAILRDFRPRELWVGFDAHSQLYSALLAEAARLGITVRHLHAGDSLGWGSVQVSALSPASAYSNPGAPRNDDSLVLELRYGKASALLEGDAETPSEQAMLAAGRVHPVTLLKVAHHGSRTSTTEALVAAAVPRDAVISVGLRNTFGHPRPEVIARLAAEGAHVFRTDRFGLSSFLLTPDGAIREQVDGVSLPSR